MSFLVVGLSYRTAPLGLLERLTIADGRQIKALADLAERSFVSEAAVLSTCHRIEVYAVAERFHGAVADARNFLSELAFVAPEDFSDHLYVYYDDAAVTHLFNVAAGVDSVVVGEDQILRQVRAAWERARDEGVAGPRLSALFRHALELGKRARSETAGGRRVTSLSQAAVALAESRLGSLDGRRLVVLGAGEMGEGIAGDVASAATEADLVVASRTDERARRLAERVGGRAVALGELPAALADADALLTSTGASTQVVTAADLETVVAMRNGRPLLIIDLGMPRDVDPAVCDLAGVTLLDLADVATFVKASTGASHDAAGTNQHDAGGTNQHAAGTVCSPDGMAKLRSIVADEVSRFLDAQAARQVAPTLTALRARAEALRTAEMGRYRQRLSPMSDDQWARVDTLTKAILAKLLHEPTVRLKDATGSARGERLAGAMQELFDL